MSAGLRHFKNPWFLIFVSVFLLHQFFQKGLGRRQPFFDAYLDPLLFMPIFFHCLLWEKRFLLRKGVRYRLSWIELSVWTIAIGIIAEYLFPEWNAGFTSDPIDLLCYLLGTLFFAFAMNGR